MDRCEYACVREKECMMKYTVSKQVLRIEYVIVCIVSHPNPECVFKAKSSDDTKERKKCLLLILCVFLLFLKNLLVKYLRQEFISKIIRQYLGTGTSNICIYS